MSGVTSRISRACTKVSQGPAVTTCAALANALHAFKARPSWHIYALGYGFVRSLIRRFPVVRWSMSFDQLRRSCSLAF